MNIFRTIRIFLFGPSKSDLDAEITPPEPLLSDAQLESLRRDVRRVNWIKAD